MKSREKSKWLGRAAGVALAAGLSGAGAVQSARAVALAQYPFTGSSFASTDTDPASVASNIVIGPGLTDSTHIITGVGNPAPAARIGTDETDGTSTATAVAAGDYVTATLTPNAGQRLVFTTLTFDLDVSTSEVATNVVLQASVNGGSTFATIDTFTSSTAAFTPESENLAAYNNNAAIAAGAAVVFRLAVYDNANNADEYTALDNVTVNGTTTSAVPEPGTVAMLALGALATGGVILRRRRREA